VLKERRYGKIPIAKNTLLGLVLQRFELEVDSMSEFWINLFSTLVAALIIFCIGRVFGYFTLEKPDLSMVVKQKGSYSDTIIFTKQDDGSHVADFQLAIENKGKLTLKADDGFWHTFIKTDEAVTPLTAPGEHDHQRGLISYSIYPGYIVDIDGTQYHLVIKKGDKPAKGLPYFFATDYGFFPNSTKFDLGTGQVSMSTIGLIKFEVKEY